MKRPFPGTRKRPALAVLLVAALACTGLHADPVRVAAASNFRAALEEIASAFEQQTGQEIVLIFGSTGKLYAQLLNGAPYELFFAADAERPRLLEDQGISLPGRRYTYAVGRLALWGPDDDSVEALKLRLESGSYRRLAMANPELAPYGRAAKQALFALGLWNEASRRIVTGENVAQAYQFVASGNAELGFVARALLERTPLPGGSWWLVPESMHEPVAQQVVLLTDDAGAGQFFNFARGPEALEIIRARGYAVPDDL